MTATTATALFDVDGTLADRNYLYVVTWWEAFAQAGHEVPTPAIHRSIGMGSDQLLDVLLPATRDREADPGVRAAHGALYATYWSRLRPHARAPELLRLPEIRPARSSRELSRPARVRRAS
jgi:phosphoglycolate phosphatase-like HAD superfamily hydrolase